jgi:hypothetical protein
MLAEAWRLCKSLEEAGVPVEVPHSLIKPIPVSAKLLLRIRLDENGRATAVEQVFEDERVGLRRIVQTSDGSYPVLKVNQPFLDIRRKSPVWKLLKGKKKDKARVRLLHRCLAAYPCRKWTHAGWKWNSSRKKAELLTERLKGDQHASPLADLGSRFKEALMDPGRIINDIARMALDRVEDGRLSQLALATVQDMLVGKGKNKRGHDKPISVLLALDLDDDRSSGQSVYSARTWRRVAEVLPLNLAGGKREHEHRAQSCAFTEESDLWSGPFPQVKLPVLRAYFPLVSMASDGDKAKCNERYGLTEWTVVSVSVSAVRKMHGALTWVLHADREGRTWCGVASGGFEKRAGSRKKQEKEDLLIAFVEGKPELDARTASYFGAGKGVIESKFEADAEAVCRALDAVVRERPGSRLNLFLIRKVSDGQAQIALAESPTVQKVISAAERWQKAVKENLPAVTLQLPPSDEGAAAANGLPWVPYPDQVVRLLSYQWVRDGSSPKSQSGKAQAPKQAVVGPALAEVLFQMLWPEGKWEPAANRLLSMLLQRLTPLLIGVFGAARAFGPRQDSQRQEPLFGYPRDSRQTALRGVAVLGILLDALNCRKEVYMENAPYQVGQVMALADTIHKDYCVVVRKGSLPNSLIGTGLMRRSLDNPAAGLAELAERMLEYLRWAKTVEVPRGAAESDPRRKAVKEAKETLRKYQPLAAKLGNAALPIECTDVMKAQLLLGFLASPPEGGENQDGHDGKDGDK